jgi:trimeric autotransporter adhesin
MPRRRITVRKISPPLTRTPLLCREALRVFSKKVSALQQSIPRAYEGTAIAIALGAAALPSDKKFAVSANLGTFRGQSAFGGSAQIRVNENLVLNAGVGAGFREGGVAGRVGATFAW